MKKESDLCTIIKNSFNINGFKIPDPSSDFRATIKKAFDGIGIMELNGKFFHVNWEAKFMNKMQAFSFNRLAEHQKEYLEIYSKPESSLSYIILGINISRSDKRVYIFDWSFIDNYIKSGEKSIFKKDLEKLPYNKIKKGIFNFENIINI